VNTAGLANELLGLKALRYLDYLKSQANWWFVIPNILLHRIKFSCRQCLAPTLIWWLFFKI